MPPNVPPVPPYPIPPLHGPISMQTPARIRVAQFVRNGLVPHAGFETTIGRSTGFLAAIRTKELFRWSVPIADIPTSSSSARTRWRFAARTSPLLGRILVTMMAARQNNGDSIFSPSITLHITNADESTTYGTATFSFGASNTTTPPDDLPSEFGTAELVIDGVPADTVVYGKFVEAETGRLVATSVYEESLPVTEANGYVVPSQVAALGPIYADRRQSLLQLAADLWKKQASHLFSWSVDDQATPLTTTSTTAIGLLDDGTVPDDLTAGWTLDTQFCGTRARPTTVPCVFAARSKVNAGSGRIKLKNALGTTLATISVTDTSPTWYTTTVDLDSVEGKYYVTHEADSTRTTSTYAVSLFQYAS